MSLEFMDGCAVQEPVPIAFAPYDVVPQLYSKGDVSAYVMSSPYPRWLGRAKNKIEELGRLPSGWDSYEGKPVTAVAQRAAYSLLRQLANAQTPEPEIVPTSDGSIQIEWHTRGIDLEIRMLSSTKIGVSFEDYRGVANAFEDELQYDFTVLREAIRLLSNR